METERGLEGRADALMAQVEWKGMCLDIRCMIVAPSDDMGESLCWRMPPQRQTELFLRSREQHRAGSVGKVRLMVLGIHTASHKAEFLSNIAEKIFWLF